MESRLNETTIRSLANIILRELQLHLEALHLTFKRAFGEAEENNLARKIYLELYPSLVHNVEQVERLVSLEEIEAKFSRLKKAFTSRQDDAFKQLLLSEKTVLTSLIDAYHVFTKQQYLLSQLINLGGVLKEAEHACSAEDMLAQTQIAHANKLQETHLEKITSAMKLVITNTHTLAQKSNALRLYENRIRLKASAILIEQQDHENAFKQHITVTNSAFSALNEKIKALLSSSESTKKQFKTEVPQVVVFEDNIKSLLQTLSKMNAVTILQASLQNDDAVVVNIMQFKQTFEKYVSEHEAVEAQLNQQADELRAAMKLLYKQWKDNQASQLAQIEVRIRWLQRLSIKPLLEIAENMYSINDIPEISLLDELTRPFHDSATALHKALHDLEHAKDKMHQLSTELHSAHALEFFMQLKQADQQSISPLLTVLTQELNSCQEWIHACGGQYTDLIINRLSTEQQKRITRWSDAEQQIKKTHHELVDHITRLQETINARTLATEVAATRAALQLQTDGLMGTMQQLVRKHLTFTQLLKSSMNAKQMVSACVRELQEVVLQKATEELTQSLGLAVPALEQIRAHISQHKPTLFVLPKQRIELMPRGDLQRAKKLLQTLLQTLQDKINLQSTVKLDVEKQARRVEFDAVFNAMQKENIKQPALTIERPDFFHRHWKILAGGTGFASVSFAIIGVVLGLVAAPVTFGLSVPVFALLSMIAGTMMGGLGSLVVCVLKDRLSKPSTTVMAQMEMDGSNTRRINLHMIKQKVALTDQCCEVEEGLRESFLTSGSPVENEQSAVASPNELSRRLFRG